MAAPRLTERQERTLLWFVGPSDIEEGGEPLSRALFQYNTWALPDEVDRRELHGLRRRKLLSSEGRGQVQQWMITTAGIEALRANGHDVAGEAIE